MSLPSRRELFPPAVEAAVRLGVLEASLHFRRRPPFGVRQVIYEVTLRLVPCPAPAQLLSSEGERSLGDFSLVDTLALLAEYAPHARQTRRLLRQSEVPRRFDLRVEIPS